MADDIDIEEHDLLENPQVAGICLEFPNIKPEPVDYEDNYEEYSGIAYDESYPLKLEPLESDTEPTLDENASLSIAPETVQSESNITATNLQRNRIILGKKPCLPKRYWQRPCPKSKKIKPLTILLEDWGERLNSSPCYCQECETLFATRNAIDAHNMIAHSFLVPVEIPPSAIESRRSSPVVSRRSSKEETEAPPNHRFCTHCNKHFEDDNLLIQHLYDLIQAKQKSKDPPKPPQKPIQPVKPTSRLLKDTCLLCQNCFCYFRSWTEFKKHCNRTHGPCKAAELPFKGKFTCKFCASETVTTTAHNNHMRLIHKKGLILRKPNNCNKVVITKAKPIFGKYKCAYCDLTFNNATLVKMHQHNFHQRNKIAASKTVSVKTNNSSNTSKGSTNNTFNTSKGSTNNSFNTSKGSTNNSFNNSKGPRVLDIHFNTLLPKNVLFKCSTCPRHFLNCITCLCHSVQCSKKLKTRLWKCEHCNRIFGARDKLLHQFQHKNTKEFKVYVKHENIYARVLYRCLTCDVYFEERSFLKHTTRGCDTRTEMEYCKTCKVNINNSVMHIQRHVKRKLIKSDFIFIDEFIQPNMAVDTTNEPESSGILHKLLVGTKPTLKRKIETEPLHIKVPRKKRKVTTESIRDERILNDSKKVYYCYNCHYFLRTAAKRSYHISKLCRGSAQKRYYCSLCGLAFTTTLQLFKHKKRHEQKKFNIKNISIICVKTLKPCVPPLPEFIKCKHCGVHFLSRHRCSKKYWINCKLCKKNFNDIAYPLHIQHHKYFAKSALSSESIENTLKMKYNMLTPTWNILYNCETCDVTTDSYDDVINHCQKHFNDMQSFDVTIQNCQECSLNFEDKCYKKHRELHSNQTIDKNSFTILNYDYTKLLTADWLTIFNPLPREQMSQILRCSIYVTRQVKMTLLQSGPPEYTIYKCQNCEEIVASQEVLAHTEARACKKRPQAIKCKICGLVFASERAKAAHVSIHNEQSVTVDSLRMVAFNHPDESDFNKTLRFESKVGKPAPKKVSRVSAVRKKRQVSIVYFRCEKCYICTSRRDKSLSHVCPLEADTRLCNKCNNVFPSSGYALHSRRHAVTGMSTGDMVIKPFNVNIKAGEKRVQLTECQSCQVKFPTHLTDSHQCSKKQNKSAKSIPTMKLYRCTTCKSVFTYKEHLDKHSLTCNAKAEIAPTPKRRIFKCQKCSLYTLTERSMKHHAALIYDTRENCPHCKFIFSKRSLTKHIELHHTNLQLTAKDFTVVVVDQQNCSHGPIKRKQQLQEEKSEEKVTVPFKISEIDKKVMKTFSRKARLDERNIKKGSSVNSSTPGDKDEHDTHNKMAERNIEKESNDNISTQDVMSENENDKEYPRKVTHGHYGHYKQTAESMQRKKYTTLKNTLFRCAKCELYYLSFSTWITHIQINHRVKTIKDHETCTVCKFKFTYNSFKKHIDFVHPALAKGILEIVTPEESLAIMTKPQLSKIPKDADETQNSLNNDSIVSQSGAGEEASMLEDSNQSQEESTSPQPKQPPNTTSSKKYTHKIYKCGPCNVYFMSQNTCYIHMLHHIPIDPKDYIECKLCNLPFKIISLNTHVRKHHKDSFKLEEVLVEEYTNEGKTIKIELYYAIDKVQSRLVSTTSEDPDVVFVDDSACNAKNNDLVIDKTVNDLVETSLIDKTEEDNGEPSEITDEHNRDASKDSNKEGNDKDVNKDEAKEQNIDDLDVNNKEKDNNLNKDKEAIVTKHQCQFCGERFNSNTSKEFHESLDHLDGEKSCVICDKSFNASILNELHLSIKNDTFECCVCEERYDVKDMTEHSLLHS